MPGHSFNSATQVVVLCIVGFTGGAAFQVSLSETLYFKLAEDEVFGVKQENQFIQPGNQQRYNIVTFHNDLPADLHIYLFGRHHQAFHALGSVNEQFRQCAAVSVQADIGGMLEHLIGFLRHHFASRTLYYVHSPIPTWFVCVPRTPPDPFSLQSPLSYPHSLQPLPPSLS